MVCQVYFEDRSVSNIDCEDATSLKSTISQKFCVSPQDLFITINGKSVPSEMNLKNTENVIRIYTKLVGGKGGFGSMLRAIGAQIEKTTNREACRDLSGRRLRDINEEKRLRKWLEGQEDREREAVERKQKKLERLIAEPKISVNLNPTYEKERKELPERVSAAVDAGWQAAGTSESGTKRKAEDKPVLKKKKKLWIDAELSDCSSLSEDEEGEGEGEVKKSLGPGVSTDSGNESDKVSDSGVLAVIVLLALVVLVAARPQEFEDEDEVHEAGDRKDDVGRVQIKVYRGPTKHDGYAPWGFWVKQPSDEK